MNTEKLNAQILETVQRCERNKLTLHIDGYTTEAGDVYNFTLTFPGAAGYPSKLAEQDAWLEAKIASAADWAPGTVPDYWLGRKEEVLEVLNKALTQQRSKQASYQAKPAPESAVQPEYHNSALDKEGFVVVKCCNQLRKFMVRAGMKTKLATFEKSVMEEAPLGKSFCFQLKLAPTKFRALRIDGEPEVLTCC